MKLSPLNIRQQEFGKSLRGYNPEEVKNFLLRISEHYENLLEENEKLKKENEQLREKIKEYQKIEKNLQDTLLNARESTTRTVESVKKQTALMLKEAELKARQIIEKAKTNADFIREGVAKLKEEKHLLIARLKAMLEIQEKILDIKTETVTKENTEQEENNSPKTDKKKDIDADEILEKLL